MGCMVEETTALPGWDDDLFAEPRTVKLVADKRELGTKKGEGEN